jgi:hypothetical protein
MDPSNNNSVGTHLSQHDYGNNFTDFLGDIHNYAAASDQQLNDNDPNLGQMFDPALFQIDAQESPTPGHQAARQQAQQQPNYQSAFTQHAARQSQSPALPAYNPNQHQFTQQSHFTQPVYDQRANMFQNPRAAFDPRFYQQRPSHSPGPLDQHSYQPSNFSMQGYPQQQMGSQRATPNSTGPNFSQNQQPYGAFINFDSRDSGRMQQQSSQMMPFNTFPEPGQKSSAGFVNPSMLDASPDAFMANQYPNMTPRPLQPAQYHQQPGQTIDPRSLGRPPVQPPQQQIPQVVSDLNQPGKSVTVGKDRPMLMFSSRYFSI